MTTICRLIRLDCCFREEDRWLGHTALTFVLSRNRPVCCPRISDEKVLSGDLATSQKIFTQMVQVDLKQYKTAIDKNQPARDEKYLETNEYLERYLESKIALWDY